MLPIYNFAGLTLPSGQMNIHTKCISHIFLRLMQRAQADFLVDEPWFYIVWLYPDVVYKLQNKEYFLSFRNFRAKGVSFYMALPLCEGLPFSSRLNGQF